jgi:2-methylisocitrate lyase-like PEP mutase family enzyme
MADSRLKDRLASGKFLAIPGVFDMMSLLMVEKVGFDAVYASGYWTAASHLGIPDVGLATYTDFINRFSLYVKHSSAPLIADADTGFGGLLNVAHTVKGYEDAGISAIQIEDQEFPKKCGHTPHRRVVPIDDMVQKIRVAVDTRDTDNFLVIARTDARSGLGLDEALRRGEAYAKAGADILFIESPQSEEEMAKICSSFDVPCLANMSNGGHTPMLSTQQLTEIGYSLAIYPAMASLAMLNVIEKSLTTLKDKGLCETDDIPLYEFNQFCKDIGFDEVHTFEKKYGRYE